MSTSEYPRRMNKVLDHIDLHLDAPLDLPHLADVAHFSPYHFHRIFAAWMGETLGDYVRRRRLEMGARRLCSRSHRPVLEIALSVGFSSGEAFARAFKLYFGCSPSAWRIDGAKQWAAQLSSPAGALAFEHRNFDQALSKPDQIMDAEATNNGISQPIATEIIMQVELVNLPATRIAYMRHIGPYGESISRFWHQTFLPWRLANNLTEYPCYGIGHDDPSLTPADKCRYDAAVEIPENFVPGNHVIVTYLPGGRYAVAQFEDTLDKISQAWQELCRNWLAESGMTFDDRPAFERYGKNVETSAETGVLRCEICIPVRPL